MLNLPLTWEHFFLQLIHKHEFALTPVLHILLGHLTDLIVVFGASVQEHITFVFPTFTFNRFLASPLFHFFSFLLSSSSFSAIMIRSSVYSNCQGYPTLSGQGKALMIMIKLSGLNTDLLWTVADIFTGRVVLQLLIFFLMNKGIEDAFNDPHHLFFLPQTSVISLELYIS